MTEGRFETSYNLRNTTFENRSSWTDSRKHKMDAEHARFHKEQESCPYHDLRANGCFMPHDWDGAQENTQTLTAQQVMARPNGSSMKMAMGRNKNTGCGGAIMPDDTDPLPPVPPSKVNNTPWTSTGKSGHPFSTPQYISAPDRPKPKSQYEPPFHTGASNTTLGKPFAFVPGDCARKMPPPPAFRLKAGTYKGVPLPPVARLAALSPQKAAEASSPQSAPSKKKKTEFKKREPYVDAKTLRGTFGKVDAHVPTPYTDTKMNAERHFTMFTYASKSKRGMPVQASWDSAPNAVRVAQ